NGPVSRDNGPLAQPVEGGVSQGHAVTDCFDISEAAPGSTHRLLGPNITHVYLEAIPFTCCPGCFNGRDGASLTNSLASELHNKRTTIFCRRGISKKGKDNCEHSN